MSLTQSEQVTRRLILRKFESRGFVVKVRGIAECGALPGEACPICFPGLFAADLDRAPRAVVCAKHYWHPVARLFRSVTSLFLPSRGRCLPQKGGGGNPSAESGKGARG